MEMSSRMNTQRSFGGPHQGHMISPEHRAEDYGARTETPGSGTYSYYSGGGGGPGGNMGGPGTNYKVGKLSLIDEQSTSAGMSTSAAATGDLASMMVSNKGGGGPPFQPQPQVGAGMLKVGDEESPIRALPPIDYTRFDFLQDDERRPLFPPQKHELGLGLFRKLFQTLCDRFGNEKDEIHINHFERAMRRVLRVIDADPSSFRAETYDVDQSGAVGWWEFVAVWKDNTFYLNLSTLERIFLTFEEPQSCQLAHWLSCMLLFTIMFSSMLFIVGTLPEFREWPTAKCEATCDVPTSTRATWSDATKEMCLKECEPKAHKIFDQLEVVCVLIFSAEYLLRLLTCHGCRPEILSEEYLLKLCLGEYSLARRSGRLRRFVNFVFTPMNLVDVLAIVPFYLELIVGDSGVQGSTVLRVVRLTRLFRFMKVAKYVNTLTVIGRVFSRSFLALAVLLFVLVLFVTVSASVIYFAESGNWDPMEGTWTRWNWVADQTEATPFKSIPHSMWWSFVTYTTVGYGDMAPTSLTGQLAGIVSMLTALLVVAMPTSVLLNNFTDVWTEHHAEVHIQTKQTQVERETVENVMQFEEPQALLQRVQIECYDENVLGEFIFLGECVLEFDLIGKSLQAIDEAEHNGLKSLRRKRRSSDLPDRQIYSDAPPGEMQADEGVLPPKESPTSKRLKMAPVEFDLYTFHGKIETPLQNNIMKSVKTGQEKEIQAQGSIEVELKWSPYDPVTAPVPATRHNGVMYHPGQLSVKVVRARYLFPAHESDEFFGEYTASPHASVQVWTKVPASTDVKLESVSQRTKTMHDDVNPVWNEELVFEFLWRNAEMEEMMRQQQGGRGSLQNAAERQTTSSRMDAIIELKEQQNNRGRPTGNKNPTGAVMLGPTMMPPAPPPRPVSGQSGDPIDGMLQRVVHENSHMIVEHGGGHGPHGHGGGAAHGGPHSGAGHGGPAHGGVGVDLVSSQNNLFQQFQESIVNRVREQNREDLANLRDEILHAVATNRAGPGGGISTQSGQNNLQISRPSTTINGTSLEGMIQNLSDLLMRAEQGGGSFNMAMGGGRGSEDASRRGGRRDDDRGRRSSGDTDTSDHDGRRNRSMPPPRRGEGRGRDNDYEYNNYSGGGGSSSYDHHRDQRNNDRRRSSGGRYDDDRDRRDGGRSSRRSRSHHGGRDGRGDDYDHDRDRRDQHQLVPAGGGQFGNMHVALGSHTVEADIARVREDVRDIRRGVAELLELTRCGNVIVLPGGGPRRNGFQNHLLD
ncbi:unnamed protein product [Amoebophrya sp. A25]|nr:unnamed protein product [Amoebophrya sp. A25]|eukprot:GSA25T00006634001.1